MGERKRNVSSDAAAGGFHTTRWTLVLRAGDRNAQDAAAALATLCERYWYPVYAYVRRRLDDVDDAQDLTQEFFARLVEKNVVAAVSPSRGRFRSFLLTAVKNFLANQQDRAGAQKRGGGRCPLSLDWEAGESRLRMEPSHDLTPQRCFERQWVLTLLDLVMRRLAAEYAASGRTALFEALRGALVGDRDRLPFAALAAGLGMSEDAARQAAGRLRKRYRELLRDEVSHTVARPTDIDEEIRSLFRALGK